MSIPEIAPAEAVQMLASDAAPALVDVREQEEWDLCRLSGAELIPVSQFGEFLARRFTDPEERLLFYCHHGVRSRRVAEYLAQQGFTGVMNLTGGIDRWSMEVDPAVPRY